MGGNYNDTSKFAKESVFGNRLSQVRDTKQRLSVQPPQSGAPWESILSSKPGTAAPVQSVVSKQSDDDIERLALYDSLTDLYNHRTFMRHLTYELKRGMRYKRPVAVCLISIDGLDTFCREYGDMTGDFIRKEVAREIRNVVRDVDIPARYSGKEFIVLFPETNSNGATSVADRLKNKVGSRVLNLGTQSVRVTISLGVASFPTHGREPAELLGRAFQALEIAIQRGGDRHVVM